MIKINRRKKTKNNMFTHLETFSNCSGEETGNQRYYSNTKSRYVTLRHLLFDCLYSKLFWKDFEFYFYSLSKKIVHLSLQDVLIGIITSECPLLNYLLLIAKVYLWDCRRTQILPSLTGLKVKIKIKLETEKYICTKNNTLNQFNEKWAMICQV